MSKKLNILMASVGAVVVAGVGVTAALTTQGFAQTGTSAEVATDTETTNKLVDETVYVFTDTSGSTRKIITSDWTRNLDVDEYTNFRSDDKKVPIELAVSYWLDGKEISAEELAGKSGKVTVRYNFSNHEMAGGYYVPYAVVSGIVLNNEHFSNVEAKNAKIVNDGNRTIVAGVTTPGLAQDLGVDENMLPSYIEFTADTSDFELGMTVSVATNELFENLDISKLDSISAVEAELNKMSSAMEQLISGSSDLASGLEVLYDNVSALPENANALAVGAKKLNLGAAKIEAGTKELSAGLEQLSESGDTLVQTAGQLSAVIPEPYKALYAQFYAGLQQYTSGVTTISEKVSNELEPGVSALANGSEELANGAEQLSTAAPKLVDGVEQLRDGSKKLNDGLSQFNTEAVQKIIDFYNGNVKSLVSRLQEIARVAKNNSTKTKYIYRTDEIKK